MIAQWNAPISDRFSSLCARVFSPAAAMLESEKTLGTRLTVNDDHAVFNLSDLSHCDKTCKTSITGTGTQMEKPGKVFYLFYFISFALKNTKKHYRYANTSNRNVTIH